MEFLTIITPTYNRSDLLINLYNSLVNQTNNNFIWLVIDDGSTDDTKEIVEKLKKENKIKIKYLLKENGGKHTALNLAFKNLETNFSIIVDSDDTLTNDAVETIYNYNNKYFSDNKICGFCFLKGYSLNESVVSFPKDEEVSTITDYVINAGLNGDKCEVFKSSILEKTRE